MILSKMRSLGWLAPFFGAVLLPVTSEAALNDGISRLLAKGDKVVTQQFMIRKEVSLPEVKVNLQLRMTVTPEKANELTKTLKSLKTPGGRHLFVTGIQQTTTNTGLVNLTAQIVGNLPITDLADITALIKSYNKSGRRLTLIKTAPYFPDKQRQQIENKLALSLYKRAQTFLKQLNHTTAPFHYTIGAMNLSQFAVQAPRPIMMERSFASVPGASSNGALKMQKVITMYSSVAYISQK